jgi:hypothetical protein
MCLKVGFKKRCRDVCNRLVSRQDGAAGWLCHKVHAQWRLLPPAERPTSRTGAQVAWAAQSAAKAGWAKTPLTPIKNDRTMVM